VTAPGLEQALPSPAISPATAPVEPKARQHHRSNRVSSAQLSSPGPRSPDVTAQIRRARDLLAHGSIEQACSEATLAAQLAPTLAEIWEFLGQCNMRLGRPELARSQYRRFLELAPSSARAPFIRAIVETTG
jgi:Flp pilus assembly protein TadD